MNEETIADWESIFDKEGISNEQVKWGGDFAYQLNINGRQVSVSFSHEPVSNYVALCDKIKQYAIPTELRAAFTKLIARRTAASLQAAIDIAGLPVVGDKLEVWYSDENECVFELELEIKQRSFRRVVFAGNDQAVWYEMALSHSDMQELSDIQ